MFCYWFVHFMFPLRVTGCELLQEVRLCFIGRRRPNQPRPSGALIWSVCPVSPVWQFIYPSLLDTPLIPAMCTSAFSDRCVAAGHSACSRGRLHSSLLWIFYNWYRVLTCRSVSVRSAACHSKLTSSISGLLIGWRVHSNVSLQSSNWYELNFLFVFRGIYQM